YVDIPTRKNDTLDLCFGNILMGLSLTHTLHSATPITMLFPLTHSFYTRFDTQDHSSTCEELLNAFPLDVPAQHCDGGYSSS
ncbi:Hypothetical predicted protein, partial [Scomber scombrus]